MAVAVAVPVAVQAGSCSSITTPAIAFGTALIPGTTNVEQVTLVSTVCSVGTAYTISFGPGNHPTTVGPTAHRQLASGSNLMQYDIYQDSARTTYWGDGSDVVGNGLGGTGNGGTQQYPVYSVLNVPTNAAIGSYSDTVVVTISF